jgi:hypothetical protein
VLSELRFDVIQPNGTNDKNGHRQETMRFAGRAFQQKMPAAALLKLEVLDKRQDGEVSMQNRFHGCLQPLR